MPLSLMVLSLYVHVLWISMCHVHHEMNTGAHKREHALYHSANPHGKQKKGADIFLNVSDMLSVS